jgi:hypothetical protein
MWAAVLSGLPAAQVREKSVALRRLRIWQPGLQAVPEEPQAAMVWQAAHRLLSLHLFAYGYIPLYAP